MFVLAAVFHFFNSHGLLALLLLTALGLGIGGWLARRQHNPRWWRLGGAAAALGAINVFAGASLNALFLNAVGSVGSAVLIHAEETSSQRNEQFIWAYQGVLTTAEGQDVRFGFDSTSVSVYPLGSQVRVPPLDERFVVKYVPGFERNLVIMVEQSAFGRRHAMALAQQPVNLGRSQWRASPDNPAFQEAYRRALQQFLREHGAQAPQAVADYYRRLLAELDASAVGGGHADGG